MSFGAWRRWVAELPWALRWFVVLVLVRPLLDTLYFLKEISPFLSPLYIVGVLTPVAVVASYYARGFPRTPRSALDPLMGAWGWLLALSSLAMVAFFASADSLEVGLKITAPVFLYFFCRHLVRSRRDLAGILTTFLYSTAVPLGMLLYERLVSPLGALVYTREYERYGGLYADVVNYALYSVGAMLVVCYFFLAQPPGVRFRTHVTRLVVVGALFVVALLSVHHAASYGVAGALVLLLVFHSLGGGRFAIPLVVAFALGLAVILVGDTIAQRVDVMFANDVAVLSGEKDAGAAFHGRMSRWEVYLDYWEGMPATAKLLGAALSGAGEGTLRTMLLGGIHSDYLRVTFASGLVGLVLYLSFCGGLLLKALQARWAERFLVVGAVAAVLMYSITILPTLYAPLMYLCLPIFAYAALPRSVLRAPEPASVTPVGGRRRVPPPYSAPPPRHRRAAVPPPVAPSGVSSARYPARGQASHGRLAPAPVVAGAHAAAVPSALVEAVLDEVLARGIVDWVMAGEVALAARRHGAADGAEARAVALQVIETALRRGLAKVGDVTDAGFQVWRGGVVELAARVARCWPETLEPGLGDVCWLDLTGLGLACGQEAERDAAARALAAPRPDEAEAGSLSTHG